MDIPLLSNYFAEQFCREYGKKALHFSDKAIQLLQSYNWPGNVRELKNIVERVVIMSSGNTIAASDVFDLVQKPTGRVTKSMPLRQARQEFEKEYIMYHLQRNEWNVNKTAQELRIDRTSLYKKMRTYRIALPAAL